MLNAETLKDNKLDLNKLQEDPLSLIHSGVIYYLRGNMKPLQLTAWCQTSQSSKFLFEGEISNMNSFPSTDCISYYYPLTVCFFCSRPHFQQVQFQSLSFFFITPNIPKIKRDLDR